jgi:hypothetical protein
LPGDAYGSGNGRGDALGWVEEERGQGLPEAARRRCPGERRGSGERLRCLTFLDAHLGS